MRLVISDQPHGAHPPCPSSPSLWREKRGHQHGVYWRNAVPDLPARSYVPFHGRDAAEQFVGTAGLLGLDTARHVLTTDDLQEVTALLQAAWAERGLTPAVPMPQSAPELPPAAPAEPPLFSAAAGPRLTGVTFDELCNRFLGRIRNVDESTHKLYEGSGRNHLLSFSGGTDIGPVLRTRPLRAADALYVDDDWVTGMLEKERRDNAGRPIAGSLLSMKSVDNYASLPAEARLPTWPPSPPPCCSPVRHVVPLADLRWW